MGGLVNTLYRLKKVKLMAISVHVRGRRRRRREGMEVPGVVARRRGGGKESGAGD